MTTSPSASKLIPASPSAVMVIRDLTPDLTICSTPFARFGRIRIGGRGTIVRLQTGSIAVFSPTALTPEVSKRLEQYGNRVKYLAAMDIEHHIFISSWKKAYPEAEVIGMEGLPEKRAKDPATRDVKFDHVFSPKNKLEYKIGREFDEEFDYELVDGHDNQEMAFFHRPSKAVIVADLFWNLPATEQYSRVPEKEGPGKGANIMTRLFNWMQNADDKGMIWQKRFVYYIIGSKNRESFKGSVQRMGKWDIQKIVPCHGDVIEQGAKRKWDLMFDWFVDGKK